MNNTTSGFSVYLPSLDSKETIRRSNIAPYWGVLELAKALLSKEDWEDYAKRLRAHVGGPFVTHDQVLDVNIAAINLRLYPEEEYGHVLNTTRTFWAHLPTVSDMLNEATGASWFLHGDNDEEDDDDDVEQLPPEPTVVNGPMLAGFMELGFDQSKLKRYTFRKVWPRHRLLPLTRTNDDLVFCYPFLGGAFDDPEVAKTLSSRQKRMLDALSTLILSADSTGRDSYCVPYALADTPLSQVAKAECEEPDNIDCDDEEDDDCDDAEDDDSDAVDDEEDEDCDDDEPVMPVKTYKSKSKGR